MRPTARCSPLTALLLLAGPAYAQQRPTTSPGPACAASRPAVHASLGVLGRLGATALTPQGDSLWIVARVLPPEGARRFGTRVVLARIGPDGGASYGPRVVAQYAGSDDGPVALTLARDAPDEARPTVWLVRERTAVRIAPGESSAAPGADPSALFRSPARAMQAPPLLVADAPGEGDGSLTLVWRRSEHTWMQRVRALEEPGALRTVHYATPARTITVAAARTHTGDHLLVARTSARRYVLARALADGRLSWTGLGPAGCGRGRCPAVSLTPAREGVLAHWFGRPTADRIAQLGARALTDDGHPRGAIREFIPMANPYPIAGPVGEPFAVQLGHPSVLRGTRRPVALATFEGPVTDETRERHEPPARAHSYADAEGLLHVVLVARDGALAWHALRCGAALARASAL